MPQITQAGAINTTALIVPDLYVQIVPPQTLLLNGVPTDTLGIVGAANWGPVNAAVVAGGMADLARNFGSIVNRKYDLGTQVAVAVLQGAQNFRLVRVTDGTDVKASVTVGTTGLTLTALYSGTLGNSIAFTLSAGTLANSWRAVVSLPGFPPETFDNITGTGNQLWLNIAAAINSGTSALRGASQIITAVAGASTAAPAAATTLFSSGTLGTDGASSLTDASLVGVDGLGSAQTGMYCLRGQNCALAFLADVTTPSTWTTQIAFGLSETVYMIMSGPAGDTIANAPTAKATAGVDSYAGKVMFGDWLYWYDQVNQVTRLVSPMPFAAGRLANLSPEQSSLNKPLYGIAGSQSNGVVGTGQDNNYSTAELAALIGAGIDLICNPAVGGSYFAVRAGHNSSSNAAINGDNYTRLTNYIAKTLAAGMGIYVGQVINAALFQQIRATLNGFLNGMLSQGLLGRQSDGSLPFSVICDASNNPDSRTSLGYVQVDVVIKYQPINEKFIINAQGGETVQIVQDSTGAVLLAA